MNEKNKLNANHQPVTPEDVKERRCIGEDTLTPDVTLNGDLLEQLSVGIDRCGELRNTDNVVENSAELGDSTSLTTQNAERRVENHELPTKPDAHGRQTNFTEVCVIGVAKERNISGCVGRRDDLLVLVSVQSTLNVTQSIGERIHDAVAASVNVGRDKGVLEGAGLTNGGGQLRRNDEGHDEEREGRRAV